MAAIMLTQEDIDTEFPSLRFDPDESGFVDNAEAAEDTFDPDDTEADITAAGRITGYDHGFINLQAMFSGSDGEPFVVLTGIHVLKDEESAADFLVMLATEPMQFEGMEEEGVTLRSATPVVPAVALGVDARGYQAEMEISLLDGSLSTYTVFWRRGSAVLAIGYAYVGTPGSDPGPGFWRLASRMDDKVAPTLAGEITAVPLPVVEKEPEPVPSGEEGDSEQQALDQGYDLRSLTDLSDLLPGFQVSSESFSMDGSEITFEREYEPDSLSAPLGDSTVMMVGTNFDLFETEFEAAATIGFISAMEPDIWANLFAAGMAAAMGTDPDGTSIETEKLDVTIEGVTGFSAAFDAGLFRFQLHWYFLGSVRLAGFVMVLGTDLRVEDTMPLVTEVHSRASAAAP